MVKVAILMADRVDLTALVRARNLARLLLAAEAAGGERASVVIGLPTLRGRARRDAEAMLCEGRPEIIVRPLLWEPVPVGNVRRMFPALDPQLDLEGIDTVAIPRDWGWNYTDCDHWISLSDPGIGAVLPLKPTAYLVRDLAVRIVPEAYASGIGDPYWARQTEAFRLWRQATVVATSDAATVDDLIGLAGVRRERTMVMPPLVPPQFLDPVETVRRDAGKLVWWVAPSALHDLEAAADGLSLYLAEGGTLRPTIVSEEAEGFAAGSAAPVVAALPARCRDVLAGLPRQHIGSVDALARIVASGGVLWSSVIAGGDGEAVVAAAQGGAHFVGFDQPVNRATAAAFGQTAGLYTRPHPVDIAEALHRAEVRVGEAEFARVPAADPRLAVQGAGFLLDRMLEATRG